LAEPTTPQGGCASLQRLIKKVKDFVLIQNTALRQLITFGHFFSLFFLFIGFYEQNQR